MRPKREILDRAIIAAAAVTGLLCTASRGLADTYIVTALSNGLTSTVRDISPTGAVCGTDAGHAFVWRPSSPNTTTGTETILPSLIPNFSSNAFGVNAAGYVVGHTGDDPLQQHEVPVVWNPDGSITKLPLFNGVSSGGMATGINDNGQITGRNGLFVSDAAPVRWSTDGTGIYIGNPPDYADAYGWKINDNAVIAGTAQLNDGSGRAFIHANGLFTFLPLLPGASLTAAYDINEAGHVVGSSSFSGATAFFYDGSSVRALANVPGDLIQVSTALGLNNRDQIVGYGNPSPNITGAMIWDGPGQAPRYLNALIDASSPGYVSAANPGWFITEAVAINDIGQIAARGLSTSGGSYKALLLTPVHSVTGVNGGDGARVTLSVAPNPAHGPVGVQFTMSRPGAARLQVVDLAGRNVATLHDGFAGSGTTHIPWNGRSLDGQWLSPGVYFLQLHTPTGAVSRPFVLIR